MCNDRICYARCFIRIPRRIRWGKTIVKQQFRRRWVFHHDSNVPDFVASAEVMESESLLRRKWWICRRSAWVVHHHAPWKILLSMNLWTPTPLFPMELISNRKLWFTLLNVKNIIGYIRHIFQWRLRCVILLLSSSLPCVPDLSWSGNAGVSPLPSLSYGTGSNIRPVDKNFGRSPRHP